jgi:phosphoglycerate dehydrogenase-like enzyme
MTEHSTASRLALALGLALVASVYVPRTTYAAANNAAPPATTPLIVDLGLRVDARPVRERSGWRPPRTILVAAELHEQLPLLQAAAPGVKFVEMSASTPARDLAAADAALGYCSPELLARAQRVAWVQSLGAGVERCLALPGVREGRILLTNMQRAAGASMAEHVLALMLALSRDFPAMFRDQQQGRWGRPEAGDVPTLADLDGKTLLVVGLGGIGTEVAKRAHAFGMRVIATRASGRTGPDYVSYVGLPEELTALARQADFVVNCAPLTPATTGVFNATFFAAMKPTAYFLSVGRGRSTVTDDLVAALREHRIAGAGLDVTDPEPLPPNHPLWTLPRVIITPHVSGYTPIAGEVRTAILLENLRRYVAGEAMLSVVGAERGY